MPHFFFPVWGLVSKIEDDLYTVGDFSINKRLWQVTTFDLATLTAYHKVNLPYGLMDVYLRKAHFEISVTANSREEAVEKLNLFKAMLYASGSPSLLCPLVSTHSFNDYAGINSRDSRILKDKIPEGLKEGITSETAKVEVWPNDMHLYCYFPKSSTPITKEMADSSWENFKKWEKISKEKKELKTVQAALIDAPFMDNVASSLLHIWTGIEALFPDVRSEVSFRISLLIAQLSSPIQPAIDTYREARESYTHRSSAAHGSVSKIKHEHWDAAWNILIRSLNGILKRGRLPKEADLIEEMLTGVSRPSEGKTLDQDVGAGG